MFTPYEALALADAAIHAAGGPARAWVRFYFLCPSCGARCVFGERNSLCRGGTCHACGTRSDVSRASFDLFVEESVPMAGPPDYSDASSAITFWYVLLVFGGLLVLWLVWWAGCL